MSLCSHPTTNSIVSVVFIQEFGCPLLYIKSCYHWRPLWKAKAQANWSDFHLVILLWACPAWEIRSVIIQIKIKQQWETSSCSICACRRDRSQSSWEKIDSCSEGKMSCQMNLKWLQENPLVGIVMILSEGSRLLKLILFVVNISFTMIIMATVGFEPPST